jgi:protein-S-isoprenylcysteine O-methyltransferase Ste14
MELFPGLALGFLNGWVLLVVFYAVFAILLILFPREVVQRLYDRSDWSEQQKVLSALGKIFIFAWILLVVFTPLSFGTWNFILGLILFVAGLTGMVRALLDYRYTPLHEPVTQGIYRCSRNPQQVMILLAFLGISFATGSCSLKITPVRSSMEMLTWRIWSECRAIFFTCESRWDACADASPARLGCGLHGNFALTIFAAHPSLQEGKIFLRALPAVLY